jgi:hypothetical protein
LKTRIASSDINVVGHMQTHILVSIKKIYICQLTLGTKRAIFPKKNTGAKRVDSFMWDTHGVHAGQHSDMKIKLDRNNHTFINKK